MNAALEVNTTARSLSVRTFTDISESEMSGVITAGDSNVPAGVFMRRIPVCVNGMVCLDAVWEYMTCGRCYKRGLGW